MSFYPDPSDTFEINLTREGFYDSRERWKITVRSKGYLINVGKSTWDKRTGAHYTLNLACTDLDIKMSQKV